jgi:hypothetical protein
MEKASWCGEVRVGDGEELVGVSEIVVVSTLILCFRTIKWI